MLASDPTHAQGSTGFIAYRFGAAQPRGSAPLDHNVYYISVDQGAPQSPE